MGGGEDAQLSPDIVDGHMKDINLPQLLTLSITGPRVGNVLPQFVKSCVDFSLSLSLPSIGLLPPVPEEGVSSQLK